MLDMESACAHRYLSEIFYKLPKDRPRFWEHVLRRQKNNGIHWVAIADETLSPAYVNLI